ncbi:MAG: PEGA domain-containing protein [Polyangiales bacterium]
MQHRISAALLCAALVTATLAAGAQATGDQEIRRGLELRRAGHDDEALDAFRRAWELDRSPRARAQMGFAEQALGRWADADAHVREAGAAATDPWVVRNRAAIDTAIAVIDQHMGRLDVRGMPVGAAVFVDGRPVGTLPLAQPLRLVAGNVSLTLRADGFAEATRAVTVPPNGMARETVELHPVAPAPTTPAAPASPAAPTSPAEPPQPLPVAPVDPSHTSPRRTIGWTLVGVGGAAILGGLVAQVIREGRISEFNANAACREYQGAVYGGGACTDLYGSAENAQTGAIVAFAAGGALAAVGAVLVLTAPSRRVTAAALSCAPSLAGASCRLAF